ncbi:Imidazolonepropionase [Tistlia consotensis]|uniref:Imidazolonepropionase n=1 Tax=Tistlia consotensis USBA 355 TaxID=560819 RepID=A0A1Y6C8D3_9PROT|nr:amidohydrolase family protein [Tistlia consotensis]SMF51428.1 Imidazolonepropionase [Tistlia consotensis USBA 355]SNR84324.1 Imidazolonepropionase [Tistlia consotensis]
MSEILFRNARVLDVVEGAYRDGQSVLVRDGRIAAVAADAHQQAGAGVEEIDVKGRVLMPGLCDGHVHVTAITADFAALMRTAPSYVAIKAGELLNGMTRRGFTTVRDAGGADWGLARALREGRIVGPRLLFCGHALSQTGGHSDMRGPGEHSLDQCMCCAGFGHVCDGVSEMRRACREEIRKGATHLKLMVSGGVASPTDRIDSTQFSVDEIRAACDEAEAANIPVMAHAYTGRAIVRALEAGVDSIEHGNLLDEAAVATLVRLDRWLVPTLSIYEALASEGVEAGMPPELNKKVYDVLEAGAHALALATKAGVKMVYGTDLLGVMQRHQLNEFALRAKVQQPIDIIRSATTEAANLFRMSGSIGQVREGFLADLLVVDGDVLHSVEPWTRPEETIRLVMKEGAVQVAKG